ncbi:hypothetical protein L1049_003047 [Liquidambar formosana]|uniref:HMA domain-containing protein n=1 Tax=Liquidambar formosana TaxID=63359 RepID=A0AAP0R7V5_LIQFO
MATLSPFSICRTNFHVTPSHSSTSTSLGFLNFHLRQHGGAGCRKHLTVKNSRGMRTIRAVEEEQTLIPEEEVSSQQEEVAASVDQPVAVPVSPSDMLTMFFQAEGTMNETAIPKVTKALEETEGITNLKVQIFEGIASVELAKQTTVQATGVASSLVEIIQGSGFKLQTLNLSFEDEDNISD